jgi:hypothetical protein
VDEKNKVRNVLSVSFWTIFCSFCDGSSRYIIFFYCTLYKSSCVCKYITVHALAWLRQRDEGLQAINLPSYQPVVSSLIIGNNGTILPRGGGGTSSFRNTMLHTLEHGISYTRKILGKRYLLYTYISYSTIFPSTAHESLEHSTLQYTVFSGRSTL